MCSLLMFASAAKLSQEDQGSAEGPDRNMGGGWRSRRVWTSYPTPGERAVDE